MFHLPVRDPPKLFHGQRAPSDSKETLSRVFSFKLLGLILKTYLSCQHMVLFVVILINVPDADVIHMHCTVFSIA